MRVAEALADVDYDSDLGPSDIHELASNSYCGMTNNPYFDAQMQQQ